MPTGLDRIAAALSLDLPHRATVSALALFAVLVEFSLSAGTFSLRRSFSCGNACLQARASRLSIAALPLLPKQNGHILGVRG